ncbi:MAG: hypothetical protein E6Q68_01720 [Polynucleobacter sp.]|nr:MAG: hypothetical protein E6Q68_01720 [Polynucleobacter sp.]
MTEHQLQAECVQWFWNTYPTWRRMLVHVDNNSSNRIEGNKKKALGVVSGPSDLILISVRAVFFVELKVGSNTQSPEQKDFQAKVEARGHKYIILRTFQEFKDFICNTIGSDW